jgi:hypothetical protein
LIKPSDGAVGKELVEAMQAKAGLEPAYRPLLLGEGLDDLSRGQQAVAVPNMREG